MYMRKYMSKSGKDALLPSGGAQRRRRHEEEGGHPARAGARFAVFVQAVYVASIVSWVIAGRPRTRRRGDARDPRGRARAARNLALLAVVLELIHTQWPVEQPVAVAVRAVLFVVSLPFTVWALILPIAHVADIAVALVLLVVGASAKLVPWGELANRPRRRLFVVGDRHLLVGGQRSSSRPRSRRSSSATLTASPVSPSAVATSGSSACSSPAAATCS